MKLIKHSVIVESLLTIYHLTPDYNLIELAFSKVKCVIKSMEMEMQAINDLETIVLAAFATITTVGLPTLD